MVNDVINTASQLDRQRQLHTTSSWGARVWIAGPGLGDLSKIKTVKTADLHLISRVMIILTVIQPDWPTETHA